MRTVTKVVCLVSLCALLAGITGAAICEESITTKIDLGWVSKYVWRGSVYNSEACFQPGITFSHPSGVSLNIWSSNDLTNTNGNQGKFTEMDYTLNYAWSTSNVDWNAGYLLYDNSPLGLPKTQEAYISACFGGVFNPGIAINYDFDQVNGYYGAITAGYSCAMNTVKNQPTSLNLTGKLGFANSSYNKSYFGADQFSLVDLVLGASVPFTIGKGWTLTPNISYSTLVDSKLRDNTREAGSDSDNFILGVSASYDL